jgi:hypothetical protein
VSVSRIHYYLKRYLYHIFKYAPFDLLGRYIRAKFKTAELTGELKNLIIKRADTREELESAFELIQSTYKDANLALREDDSMRILKYNLLPTTIVYVASLNGEIIGTVSHILDSEFRLPIDKIIDRAQDKSAVKKCCEISGLAVKKEWRSSKKGVFMALILSALKSSYEVSGIEKFYAVTNFFGSQFNQHMFFMDRIKCHTSFVSHANKAEAYANVMHMDKLKIGIKRKFHSKELYSNLHMIWSAFPYSRNCKITKQESGLAFSPKLRVEQYQFVLDHIDKFGKDLTVKENYYLLNAYNSSELKLHEEFKEIVPVKKRASKRYHVNMKLKYYHHKEMCSIRIDEVSKTGFSVSIDENYEGLDKIIGRITLSKGVTVQMKADLVWIRDNRAGFCFSKIDSPVWNNEIDSFSSEYSSFQTQFVA